MLRSGLASAMVASPNQAFWLAFGWWVVADPGQVRTGHAVEAQASITQPRLQAFTRAPP